MDLQRILRVCMLFLPRLFSLIFAMVVWFCPAQAQQIHNTFTKDSLKSYLLADTTLINKMIPNEFKDPIAIALQFYPELTRTHIQFKIKKSASPLSARPKILDILRKPSKRKYIIAISRSANAKLSPILLKNLSFNSQIGVIGHELAHISFYNSKRGIYFIALALKHVSKKAMDQFEFHTDKRCIEHGLGFQLLSWSKEVRWKLDLKHWGGSNNPSGKRERYMNPETIITHIHSLSIYKSDIK